MKLLIAALALFLSSAASAQASHSVTLSWTPSTDTGGTVNVYRATSACTGTPSFTILKTGVVAAGPYVDTTVGIGVFCYYVTAVVNGVESVVPSNTYQGTITPNSPTNVTGVSK